jgi:hypothetical protein
MESTEEVCVLNPGDDVNKEPTQTSNVFGMVEGVDEDLAILDQIDNILILEESQYPQFTLAKNKARFLRMLTWY